jgi:hypothetical protein
MEINLGIDFCCGWDAMPKNFSDLTHGDSGAQHGSGQTVTEQVRSLEGRV